MFNCEAKLRKNITVAIDASRNGSGGTFAHLVGLLSAINPRSCGIEAVHIWADSCLLDKLPNRKWLFKHNHVFLNKSLLHKLWWQYWSLSRMANKLGCDVILNTNAATICRFKPSLTMSRNMLPFDKEEIKRFKYSKSWFRLVMLRIFHSRSFLNSTKVLFLTKYAKDVISSQIGLRYDKSVIVPHGVGVNFKNHISNNRAIDLNERIDLLYVSYTSMNKHQWNVVRAVKILRDTYGLDICISFVGRINANKNAKKKLLSEIAISDPEKSFVRIFDFVNHDEIIKLLSKSHIFVFASSCENMPNALLEAMAFGIPIASSNKGVMPDILRDGGVYFNPECSESIANALSVLIHNDDICKKKVSIAKNYSSEYSWDRCAFETWSTLRDCVVCD